MNTYHLDTGAMGEVPIDEKTKRDAISRVQWDWANGGKMSLITREYKLVRTTKVVINTDYR